MQSVINSVKGTALGVAEYLTPVLKVAKNIPYINLDYCYQLFITGFQIQGDWGLNS